MTRHQQLFARIARDHLAIPTLDVRHSDSLDFHTVSVWGLASALDAAYAAGANVSSRATRTMLKRQLNQLLNCIMDSDDPPFTTPQVAFVERHVERAVASILPRQGGKRS